MSVKNSNDTTGIQTRDLPTCTSVPNELRTAHRAPYLRYMIRLN